MKTQRTKIKIAILSLGAFSLLLLFGLESCRKYEEGPTISFRSKERRLLGIWYFHQIIINGVDKTTEHLSDSSNVPGFILGRDDQSGDLNAEAYDLYRNYILYGFRELKKYKELEVGSFVGNINYQMPHNGTQPDKAIWEIIKLKEDELAFKTVYNGDEYKMYLKPWKP